MRVELTARAVTWAWCAGGCHTRVATKPTDKPPIYCMQCKPGHHDSILSHLEAKGLIEKRKPYTMSGPSLQKRMLVALTAELVADRESYPPEHFVECKGEGCHAVLYTAGLPTAFEYCEDCMKQKTKENAARHWLVPCAVCGKEIYAYGIAVRRAFCVDHRPES